MANTSRRYRRRSASVLSSYTLARPRVAVLSVYDAFARLGRRMAKHRRERAAIRALSGLSDHALKDIGLSRGEIRSAVRGRAL